MKKIMLLIWFLMLSVNFNAQSDTLTIRTDQEVIVQKKFNKSNLNTYKSDKDFDYSEKSEVKKPTLLDRILNWIGRQVILLLEWIFDAKQAKGIFKTLLLVLPYIVAGIVLFLLIKFFLKVNTNSIVSTATNKAIVSITEDEELIKNKDLLKLIAKAIEQQNYRLAVRYYYLQLLKILSEKEFIIWEQQKTNEDYCAELQEINLKKSFKKLTKLYDFIWYGSFDITHLEFAKVVADFEQINKQLNKK